MGRKKQGIKQLIELRKSRERNLEEQQKKKAKETEKPITQEEHEKRIEMLKSIGILK